MRHVSAERHLFATIDRMSLALLFAKAAKWSWFDFRFSTFELSLKILGERGGSVVECRTPEREVRGSRPTSAVLCPWARHFTPRKYWLITQEAIAPSRHDWKIVDRDVKPQHNQIYFDVQNPILTSFTLSRKILFWHSKSYFDIHSESENRILTFTYFDIQCPILTFNILFWHSHLSENPILTFKILFWHLLWRIANFALIILLVWRAD